MSVPAKVRTKTLLSVERAVDRVLHEIRGGMDRRSAVRHVVETIELDGDATTQLLVRGLSSFVDAAAVRTRFGEGDTRFRLNIPTEPASEIVGRPGGDVVSTNGATADGKLASVDTHGGGSVRRLSQVAPGKPSEWLRYENLSRIPYKNVAGRDVPLLLFTNMDWQMLFDRENSRERNASARKGVAATALRYLKQRGVSVTSDLPGKDLAALDVAVQEAWRR